MIVGGIVPDEDEKMLLEAGVARVFHPGTALDDIAAFVRDATRARARRAFPPDSPCAVEHCPAATANETSR